MSHLAAEMNQLLEENGDTGIETVLEFGLFERSFASLPFSRMMGQFKYCQSRNGSLHRVASIIYLRKEWTIDQFYEKFAEGLPEPRMIHSTKSLIVGSEGTGAIKCFFFNRMRLPTPEEKRGLQEELIEIERLMDSDPFCHGDLSGKRVFPPFLA